MKKKQTLTVITKREIIPHKDFIRPDSAQTLTSIDETGTSIFDPTAKDGCLGDLPQPQPCVQPDPCYWDDFNRADGDLGTSASGDAWRDESDHSGSYASVTIDNNTVHLANCPPLSYHPDGNYVDSYVTSIQLPDTQNSTPKSCIGSMMEFKVTWWADNFFYATDTLSGGSGSGVLVGSGLKYLGAWRQYEDAGEKCVEQWFTLPTTKLTFSIGGYLAAHIIMGQYEGYRSICSQNYSKAQQAYLGVTDLSNGALAASVLEPIPFTFLPNQKYHLKIQRENNVSSGTSQGMARIKMWQDGDSEPDWQKIWIASDNYEWYTRVGFRHIASTSLSAPAVNVYLDDLSLGEACQPVVATSRLISMALVRSDQGYYYPPNVSVYGYRDVYFDGVLARLGIDYTVFNEFIIPTNPLPEGAVVVADFYVNNSLGLVVV